MQGFFKDVHQRDTNRKELVRESQEQDLEKKLEEQDEATLFKFMSDKISKVKNAITDITKNNFLTGKPEEEQKEDEEEDMEEW